VAVVEREGQIVAFANLWPGLGKHELDRSHAVSTLGAEELMEALFVHLMKWGKDEAIDVSRQVWRRGLRVLARGASGRVWAFRMSTGGPFISSGLRAHKDKFNPEWDLTILHIPAA
jgi:phosphatidylglycerol lysyltransferase